MLEPRIAPLQPPYTRSVAAMLRQLMPPGSEVEPLALFRTLAVHDGLFSRMRPLGAGLLGHPSLAPRERELLILRTCARAGAEYEWGVHAVSFARPLGLSEQQIAATASAHQGIRRGRKWMRSWSQRPTRCSTRTRFPRRCGAQLSARFGDDQLLEIVIVARLVPADLLRDQRCAGRARAVG